MLYRTNPRNPKVLLNMEMDPLVIGGVVKFARSEEDMEKGPKMRALFEKGAGAGGLSAPPKFNFFMEGYVNIASGLVKAYARMDIKYSMFQLLCKGSLFNGLFAATIEATMAVSRPGVQNNGFLLKVLLEMGPIMETIKEVVKKVKDVVEKVIKGFKAFYNRMVSICKKIPFVSNACPSWPALATIATEIADEDAMYQQLELYQDSSAKRQAHMSIARREKDSLRVLHLLKEDVVDLLQSYAPLYFHATELQKQANQTPHLQRGDLPEQEYAELLASTPEANFEPEEEEFFTVAEDARRFPFASFDDLQPPEGIQFDAEGYMYDAEGQLIEGFRVDKEGNLLERIAAEAPDGVLPELVGGDSMMPESELIEGRSQWGKINPKSWADTVGNWVKGAKPHLASFTP